MDDSSLNMHNGDLSASHLVNKVQAASVPFIVRTAPPAIVHAAGDRLMPKNIEQAAVTITVLIKSKAKGMSKMPYSRMAVPQLAQDAGGRS